MCVASYIMYEILLYNYLFTDMQLLQYGVIWIYQYLDFFQYAI